MKVFTWDLRKPLLHRLTEQLADIAVYVNMINNISSKYGVCLFPLRNHDHSIFLLFAKASLILRLNSAVGKVHQRRIEWMLGPTGLSQLRDCEMERQCSRCNQRVGSSKVVQSAYEFGELK